MPRNRDTGLFIFLILFLLYMTVSLLIVAKFGSTVIWDYTKFSHDNSAHLYIAATVVDNGAESKFSNIGTVWLPLFHMVLLPFVKIGVLYRTDLAGSIVNSMFVAGTAWVLYKMFEGKTGIFISLLYGLNMYSIIHASSSYMIPSGQFFSILAVYYMHKYLKNGSGRFLTKATVAVMIASLARYEAWPVMFAFLLVMIVKELRADRTYRIMAQTPLLISGAGLWIVYNWAIFGNPMQFIVNPSPGASGYYLTVISKLLHPLTIDVNAILKILWELVGPVIVLTLAGIVCVVKRRKLDILLIILSGSILLMAEGPWIPIRDHPMYYYFSLPYLLIPIGFLMEGPKDRINKKVYGAILIGVLLVSVSFSLSEARALPKALKSGYRVMSKYTAISSRILSEEGHGYILYSSIIGSYYFSTATGVSPRFILDECDEPLFFNASERPWKYNVSIVVIPVRKDYNRTSPYLSGLDRNRDYISLYYMNKTWRSKFLKYYHQTNWSPVSLYGFRVLVFYKRDSYHQW